MRLNRFIIAVLFALLCQTALSSPTSTNDTKPAKLVAIEYEVRRLPSGDRFEITLRFKGDASGRSTLTIPTRWASATNAERGIEALEVLTAGARIEDGDGPQCKHVVHRPREMLTVRYRLKQIVDGEPAANDPAGMFLPVIQPGFIQFIGWTTWIIPMADNDRRVRVHVTFADLPSDWEFASSFGLDANAGDYDGPMHRFQAALFVAGDYRLRSRAARGGPIVTAVRGHWSFGDNALADRVAKIVDGERAFWNDASQRYFLVSLMPLSAPSSYMSSRGTGLTQGFATQATSAHTLDQLDGLWTHEYFHTWNYAKLGQLPEPQPKLYWFTEGFTDYYTHLLPLRWDLELLEQYAQAYDHAIEVLAELPEGQATNDEVAKRFFTDGDTYGRVPYYRGMLLAAQWDAQIRTTSTGRHSLDDAMRTLRDEHAHGVEMLDVPRIVRVMKSYGVADPSADIDAQIERGALPRLADGVLTACISVDDATARRVDIGFDLPGSTKEGPIVGVDPEGPAYAAGMRNGQQLRSFRSVDRTTHLVEAGFEETSNGTVRTVQYLALGLPFTRQHAIVRENLDADARRRCLRGLGAN